MSEKITLPSGGWAVIRDAASVPVRLRRPVEKTLLAIGRGNARKALEDAQGLSDEEKASSVAASLDPETFDQFNELNDLLVVARVESWSFTAPITIDAVLDLTEADYDTLRTVTAKDIVSMMPNFSVSNSPDSPTNPSNG